MQIKINTLKKDIQGKVVLPGDADYDDARKIYNAMIDKHPAIIIQCISADDVMNAVNFARQNQRSSRPLVEIAACGKNRNRKYD